MRLMTLCAGSPPEEITSDRYTKDGGWDGVLVRYELPICNDPAGVARIVEALTRPAERHEVLGRFRQMAEMPSQGDAGGVKYWVESVWEAVDDQPLDVIIQACKDINRRDVFRPAPATLREQCLWVGRKREALKAMVRKL